MTCDGVNLLVGFPSTKIAAADGELLTETNPEVAASVTLTLDCLPAIMFARRVSSLYPFRVKAMAWRPLSIPRPRRG